MNITDIKRGQVWRPKIIGRPNIFIGSVNEYNETIYWYQEGFESHIFDSPFEMFIQQYHAPEEVLKPKPNPDLMDEDDDLGLIF